MDDVMHTEYGHEWNRDPTFVHEQHKNNSVFHGVQNLTELLFEGGWRLTVFMEPFRETTKTGGGCIGVLTLVTGFEPALQKFRLVMASPDCLQISMDVQRLLVRHVEVIQPTTQRLATAVAIEGTRDSLMSEPLVGMGWNVSDVLTVHDSTGKPLLVEFEWFSLDSLEEFHTGNGTDGVPAGNLDRVSMMIQDKIFRW